MMQRRHSHPRHGSELFHAQRLRKVGPEPRNRPCCSMAQIACGCDGAEAFSLWCAKDAVDDLPLYQVAQEWYVLRSLKQVDQPGAGIEKANRSLAHSNPARVRGGAGFRQLFPANDFPN